MEKIIKQVQEKVSNNLKSRADETPEEWYRRGVQKNMRFIDWLTERN